MTGPGARTGPTAPLLRRVDKARAWLRRRRQRSLEAHGLVLMYHRVADVQVDPWCLAVGPRNFEDQLRALTKHADVVPLSELYGRLRDGRSSRPVVALTFDDGYLDNLEVAKPLLERFEAPATVFIATGFVGRREAFWWDRLVNAILLPDRLPAEWPLGDAGLEPGPHDRAPASFGAAGSHSRRQLHDRLWDWLGQRSEAERGTVLDRIEGWAGATNGLPGLARPMTADEVRRLAAGGLITVGAHSVSHPRLTRLPREARRAEIVDSRSDCRRMLGNEPACFAFPHGDYDEECVELVRQAGYGIACTVRADLAWASGDRLQVPRVLAHNLTGDALLRGLRRSGLF